VNRQVRSQIIGQGQERTVEAAVSAATIRFRRRHACHYSGQRGPPAFQQSPQTFDPIRSRET